MVVNVFKAFAEPRFLTLVLVRNEPFIDTYKFVRTMTLIATPNRR